MEPSNSSHESALKKDSIVDHIRCLILDSTLSPGSRLPTRNELERDFQVSRDTVQRAIDRLVEEEFVRANGRRGTFVSDNPPHLSRYALVFREHSKETNRTWTHFETAILREALLLQQTEARQLVVFRDVGANADGIDYQKLVQEVKVNRFAGLIFTFDTSNLVNTPLLNQAGMPRVSISVSESGHPMPVVDIDMMSFMERALDYFQHQGRKKVAVVSRQCANAAENQFVVAEAKKRGLLIQPYWMQTVNVDTAAAAYQCCHLLMNPNQLERPDALIIDDDNLVESATQGLIAAGVKIPADVEVVAHGNFPWLTPSQMPVKRLGFNVNQILTACLESIDRQRRGQSVEPVTKVKARFENEVMEVPQEK
jgi:DNA-binding LacI/PurR family transcriptional regulator